MNILISYRGSPNIRNWECGAFIANAFRELGHEVDEYGTVYKEGGWISEHRFDVLQKEYSLFLWTEMNDDDRIYGELKLVNAKKRCGWFFDIAMYPEFCQWLSREMKLDHVFIANMRYLDLFKNSSFFPYAAAPEFFRPLTWPKKYDVALVGSDRPERQNLICRLKEAGVDAHLISGVFKEDYIDALASSKIIINDIAGGGYGLLSMRSWESPAAGALTIFEDDTALDGQFYPGVDCLIYSDIQDLIEKCKSLLKDESYLNKIRIAGQAAIQQRHTYLHRAKEILNVLF